MPDWKQIKLGDVAKIKHGYAFKGEYFSEQDRGPILLTPGNFAIGGGFQPAKPKYYTGPVLSEFQLKADDLVVTMTDLSKSGDTLGYPALIPSCEKYLHNQRIGLVDITVPNQISKRFLYYSLRTGTYRQHVLAGATGSTVRHTSPSRIQDYMFRIPSLRTQEAITAVLVSLDDKIESNISVMRKSDELASAIFAAEFELKQEPKLERLGKLADVIDCLHSRKPKFAESGHRYLVLADIRDDSRLARTPNFTVSGKDYTEWTRRIEAREGDCVITNVGRVGDVGQIPRGVTAAIGRNMTAIRGRNQCPPAFLVEALRSATARRDIDTKTDQGTVLSALNVKTIPDLLIPVGDTGEREAFQDKVGPLHELQDLLLQENTKLIAVRDILLPKLMSGQLRVRDAEKVIAETT